MYKILVIDDEELIRLTLEDALGDAGYEVICAEDGEDGYRKQMENHCDVVITDILMPVKEGMQTIRLFRRQWPELPVIAISGGGKMRDTDYLKTAQEMGAELTMSKPFTEDDILAAVRVVLDRRRSH